MRQKPSKDQSAKRRECRFSKQDEAFVDSTWSLELRKSLFGLTQNRVEDFVICLQGMKLEPILAMAQELLQRRLKIVEFFIPEDTSQPIGLVVTGDHENLAGLDEFIREIAPAVEFSIHTEGEVLSRYR